MNYTKEQLERLPKWAQSEIKTLEHYTKSLQEQLDQFNGESETNVFLREGMSKMPLRKDAHIEFYTDMRLVNKASIYVMKDGRIDVNTDSRLGKTMVIVPNAANSFRIDFVD